MPRRVDIQKILIIGSGPIIIGQACEFDYSGTQACKALRKLGYEIVLVNSNPATIMTDPGMADVTYIEPLNVAALRGDHREGAPGRPAAESRRPDRPQPLLGAAPGGVLDEVRRAGDRRGDRRHRARRGPAGIQGHHDAARASRCREAKSPHRRGGRGGRGTDRASGGDPARLHHGRNRRRPGLQHGGIPHGGRPRGFSASLVGQILVEESVLGWEELELEVVRDAKNQMITVCFIENVDAMGVHTGDSFCTAPMLTIAPELQERLQKYSYDIVEAIEVIGGTNIQFAHDPKTGRVVVIEINPRTSRSSALASKATGFPIAYVSSLLAGGLTLDEIPYWRDGTLEKYTPSGDYVVVKFARWAFEKFKGVGGQARHADAGGRRGDEHRARPTRRRCRKRSARWRSAATAWASPRTFTERSLEELMDASGRADQRAAVHHVRGAAQGGRHRASSTSGPTSNPGSSSRCGNSWSWRKRSSASQGATFPDDLLVRAKKDGFADRYLARILGIAGDDDPRSAGRRWASSRRGRRCR